MQVLKIIQNKEEELVQKYFKTLTLGSPFARNLKDDVAKIDDLIIKTDSISQGIHLKLNASPYKLGYKLLARNLSDIASKGGRPIGYTLAIFKHKSFNEEFLKDFTSGLKQFEVPLIGGDVANSLNDLFCANITVFAKQTSAEVPTRGGAKEGDFIYITGRIGRAFLGFKGFEEFLPFYETPKPQLNIMQEVFTNHQITSSIDVSDGFLKDLISILNASRMGAEVDVLKILTPNYEAYKKEMLTFGDDYEVIFTSPDDINLKGINKIGLITNTDVLKLINAEEIELTSFGYSII